MQGKTAIHDIMDESSLVNYWEQFSAISFDVTRKGLLSSCTLRRKSSDGSPQKFKCCFSFTIQRDTHKM